MRSLVLLATTFAFFSLVQSAANSYGDEQVTPAPGSAPAQAAPEQSAVETLQEAPEGAGSQSSGYDSSNPNYPLASALRHRFRHRVMRHRVLRHRVFHRRRFARNAYGDEQVTPGPSHGVAAPPPTEQGPSYQPAPPAPIQVHPPDGCAPPPPPPPPPSSPGYNSAVSAPAPHSAGGYAQGPTFFKHRVFKHRRVARGANSYGDEQVTPAPGAVASEPAPAEVPAEETHQEVVEGAGSQSSGYDSGAATSTSSNYQSAPALRNRFRHRRVLRHRVMKLRHRVKRAANSYGDEQVTPAPGSAPAQPAPEQNAVETLQEAPEGAGSQSSGYDAAAAPSTYPTSFRNRFRHRVMRQRRVLRHRVFHRRRFARGTYADEAVTPAPEAPAAAPEASEPVESAPDQAQQSSPEGAAIQASGYRA